MQSSCASLSVFPTGPSIVVQDAKSCPTPCDPMDYTVHGILQARILEWVAFSFPGDLPNLGTEPRSSPLRADSLSAEPQGKPKNTGVGSLSLLQGIFPTQESNQGLLHCRWILYQLGYLCFSPCHSSLASPEPRTCLGAWQCFHG